MIGRTCNRVSIMSVCKIISFLSKAAGKIGEGAVDVGVKVLVAYTESLMKGP